ncbi:MAG: hypothetical protein KA297_19910 [Kofleriaceae bacterium]|nr:hypothetical protein [Kofleriaceae bacterium]
MTTPLAALRRYVEAHAPRRGPIGEVFPFAALAALVQPGAPLPAEATPVLMDLLALAPRFDDGEGYEGHDLKRETVVVRALALCPHDPVVEARLVARLGATTFERAFARPGSPDVDKYERDATLEHAQDVLALELVRALARLPALAPASTAALERATAHRDPEVAAAASARLAGAAAAEPALRAWFDHFRLLADAAWVPRLLGPERVRLAATAAGWDVAELPSPVVHPGCLAHRSRPLETLLGIGHDDLVACVYDPMFEGWDGVVGLHQRLATLVLAAPEPGSLAWLLVAHGVAPAWMCPRVVPVPPAGHLGPAVELARVAFLERVARGHALAALRPPALVVRGEWTNLQRAFDTWYRAVVDALAARW